MNTIDNLVKDKIINNKIVLLHFDVEGSELSVLKGSINTIKTDKPYIIVETLGIKEMNNIDDFFNKYFKNKYKKETINESCSFGDIFDKRKCRNQLYYPIL